MYKRHNLVGLDEGAALVAVATIATLLGRALGLGLAGELALYPRTVTQRNRKLKQPTRIAYGKGG